MGDIDQAHPEKSAGRARQRRAGAESAGKRTHRMPLFDRAAEKVEKAAVRRGVGRPSLDPSRRTRGRSPGRQVRLPHELDARLKERAAAENRPVSEVIREALHRYLTA